MKKDKTAREINQGGIGRQRSSRNKLLYIPLRVLQVTAAVLLAGS